MFNFPSNGGLPGFRVGRPDDVPGFNMNQDGSVGRFAGGPSNAPGDNALQTTALRTGFGSAGTIAPELSGVVPANCTSAGGMLSCTTPRGRTLRPVPAPEGFPDVAPDKPQYHSYSVPSVLRGAPGPQAMQGVIDNPTPGPRLLTHPATPQGTLNEATPPLDYYAFLGATRLSGLSAAVGYYGGRIVAFADEKPKCPVQLHFGEKDASIPMTDVEIIKQKRPDCEIYVYKDAGHGFHCDERGSFHKESRDLAWQRTTAFLAKHMKK